MRPRSPIALSLCEIRKPISYRVLSSVHRLPVPYVIAFERHGSEHPLLHDLRQREIGLCGQRRGTAAGDVGNLAHAPRASMA